MRVALVGHGLPYRVEATADLAILQFAKYRLWKDLDEHWADFAENPLVHHLVHEPTEAFTDPADFAAAKIAIFTASLIAGSADGFGEILEGKHDQLPEQAFFMAGKIEDVVANAEKLG